MKRAEKYALARLMVKWGYYSPIDEITLDPEVTDLRKCVLLLFNDVLSCLQLPRSDVDVIAEKILEVSKNE